MAGLAKYLRYERSFSIEVEYICSSNKQYLRTPKHWFHSANLLEKESELNANLTSKFERE